MIQNWLKENRIAVIIISTLLLCMVAGWVAYSLYGHQLIKAMYEGKSISLLNRIIEGQAMYPLEYYFKKAERLIFRLWLVIISIPVVTFLSSMRFKLKTMVFFLLVYGLVYLASYNLTLEIEPDSTNYMSCAEHLLKGKEFYSTGFDEANHLEFIRTGIWKKPYNNMELHPYTEWGPLYPALLAILMHILNIKGITAALMVNRFFFSILITLIYLILLQIDIKKMNLLAPVAALGLILFLPFNFIFERVYTEMAYISLSFSAVFLLQKFYNCSQNKELMIILFSAIFASLAFLCKYIGVTIVITALILIIFKNGFAMSKRKIMNCLTFSSISALPLLPWLIRNKMLTGFLDGANRPLSQKDFFYNFYLTGKVMMVDFLFPDNKYAMGFVFAFFLILGIYKRKAVYTSIKILLKQYNAFILYPFLYLATLIILRSVVYFDEIQTRLTLPAYPFIIIIGFVFFYHFFNNIQNKKSIIN